MERNIALGQTCCGGNLRLCFGAFAERLQDTELRMISQVGEELFLIIQTTAVATGFLGFELLRLL